MIETTTALRTRWAAIGAAVAVTLGAVGLGGLDLASASVPSDDKPVFIPINPCRLVDTRPGSTIGAKSSPLGPSEILTVTAHGENGECTGPSTIPTGAVGLSLNVTALGQTERTFLTLWGGGGDPGTSNLNPEPGQPPTPNAVNTPLSPTGTFNIRNNAGNVNALVDVVGYYADHDHDDRYYTEGESDSRFSAKTTALYVAPTAFESRISDFDVDRIDGTQISVSDCLLAPIPLTDRLRIVDVTATVQTEVDEFISLEVVAVPNQPATGLTADEILITDEDARASLNTSGIDGDLQSVTWTLVDLVDDPANYTYSVRVCSGVSRLTVYGATVGVTES